MPRQVCEDTRNLKGAKAEGYSLWILITGAYRGCEHRATFEPPPPVSRLPGTHMCSWHDYQVQIYLFAKLRKENKKIGKYEEKGKQEQKTKGETSKDAGKRGDTETGSERSWGKVKAGHSSVATPYFQMWSVPELASFVFKERFANWESRSLLLERRWVEDGGDGGCWCCWYKARSLPISLSSTSCSTAESIRCIISFRRKINFQLPCIA